jgi:serine/threonine-protein kinase
LAVIVFIILGVAQRFGGMYAPVKRPMTIFASFLKSPGTKIGDTAIDPKDGTEFLWVPGGDFLFGADNVKHSLSGFWIAKNLVTWKQYKQFCQETGRNLPPLPSDGMKDDHPVVNVNWEDAAYYAAWAGAKLPTEEQWQKAARGTDGRRFPWGDYYDQSRCPGNDLQGTEPIGSFPTGASPYGCLDMVGNVDQWTETTGVFQTSKYSGHRVYTAFLVSGGNMGYASPDNVSTVRRAGYRPTERSEDVGFRLAGPTIDP